MLAATTAMCGYDKKLICLFELQSVVADMKRQMEDMISSVERDTGTMFLDRRATRTPYLARTSASLVA